MDTFEKMEALLHIASRLQRNTDDWGDVEDAKLVNWAAVELMDRAYYRNQITRNQRKALGALAEKLGLLARNLPTRE